MSALAKRLGLLRRQAGTALPSVTPTPPLPTAAPRAQWPRAEGGRSPEQVVEQLRKLMKLRAPTNRTLSYAGARQAAEMFDFVRARTLDRRPVRLSAFFGVCATNRRQSLGSVIEVQG